MVTNDFPREVGDMTPHLVRHDSRTAGDPWIADWPPTPLKLLDEPRIGINDHYNTEPLHIHQGKPNEQEDEVSNNKRGLYEVHVVDPAEGKRMAQATVVASSEAMAQTKAVAGWELEGDLDDYDFIIVRLGDVRPKPDRD